jgi:putative ABC transport system permease protein
MVGLAPAMRRDLRKPDDWGQTLRVRSLHESVTADLETTLLILLGAAGFVLLLAVINLGTLVLSHALERAPEIAVRSAIGASRARLIKQLVVEHGVLSASGTIAGLLLAWLTLPLLISRIPPEFPRQSDIALDPTVFAIVFVAALATSLLFSLVPILITTRPQLEPLLRQTRNTDSKGRRRLLGGLVAAQLAVAIVLGIGAALMLRTLWNLQHVNPGFDPNGVLTFRLQTTAKYNTFEKGLPYLQQVVERVRALPGVTSVGSIQHLPMSGYNWTADIYPVEKPVPPGATPPRATWRFIAWDYFETMRIPLRAGRTFTAFDTDTNPGVVIVNEAYAQREFGSAAAAIGRRVHMRSGRGPQTAEIVGVTGNVRYMSLDTPAAPELYRPLAQTFMFPVAFAVRTTGDPAQLAAAVRQAAYSVDSSVPVAEMQPLTDLIGTTLARPRLLTMLLSAFAVAGLLVTIVGVYGVVAYWVRHREREFGIRLALGAQPSRIAGSVLVQGAMLAGAGTLLAIPAAWLLARVMEAVLFDVPARDPLTFTALPVIVTVVTFAAIVGPARRASRVDPARTMKS